MIKILPDQSYLRERFDYEPLTGVLTWKKREDKSRAAAIFNSVHAGKEAGNLHGKTYRHIQVYLNGKNYKAHRLIWKLVTGEEPDVINHLNHDATNNQWANLENVDQSLNCLNASRRSDNASGKTGVSWDDTNKKWVVQVQRGKSRFKKRFADFDAAVSAAEAKRKELGFCDQHGASR